MAQARQAGVGIPARPARPPDRRLGARPRVGGTLLPRRLRADPERRARPRGGRGRLARGARLSSSAGTSRARACRCCFARGRRSEGAPGRGCAWSAPTRSPSGSSSPGCACPDEGVDVLGFLSQDELTAELLAREGARRALARRRELRDGAHARVRLRDAGRRLRHLRLPGSHGAARRGLLVPPGDPRGPRRRGRRAARRRAARAKSWVARLGRSRRSATRGTGSRNGWPRSTRASPSRRRRSRHRNVEVAEGEVGPGRVGAPRVSRRMIALFIWRGPDWGLVARRLPVRRLGVGRRSRSRSTSCRWSRGRPPGNQVIEQAVPPPQPPFRAVFSAFGVGLFANAVLPGRIGELARVAVLTPASPQQRRADTWATLVGTVFAHRVFDLFPMVLLIGYVAATAKIPHWAVDEPDRVLDRRVRAVRFRSRERAAPPSHRARGARARCRRLVTMARYGLGVMHAPVPAVSAALLQCLGWLCQLSPSGRRCARSTSTRRCRPPGSCSC